MLLICNLLMFQEDQNELFYVLVIEVSCFQIMIFGLVY